MYSTSTGVNFLITDLQPLPRKIRAAVCFRDADEARRSPASRLPSVSADLSSHTFSCHLSVASLRPHRDSFFFFCSSQLLPVALALCCFIPSFFALPAPRPCESDTTEGRGPFRALVYNFVCTTSDEVRVYMLKLNALRLKVMNLEDHRFY